MHIPHILRAVRLFGTCQGTPKSRPPSADRECQSPKMMTFLPESYRGLIVSDAHQKGVALKVSWKARKTPPSPEIPPRYPKT